MVLSRLLTAVLLLMGHAAVARGEACNTALVQHCGGETYARIRAEGFSCLLLSYDRLPIGCRAHLMRELETVNPCIIDYEKHCTKSKANPEPVNLCLPLLARDKLTKNCREYLEKWDKTGELIVTHCAEDIAEKCTPGGIPVTSCLVDAFRSRRLSERCYRALPIIRPQIYGSTGALALGVEPLWMDCQLDFKRYCLNKMFQDVKASGLDCLRSVTDLLLPSCRYRVQQLAPATTGTSSN